MGKKTIEDHSNSRLGAVGESLVQTFLLEHCDWCYRTQEKHPADLIVELGSAKYTIQVKTRRETKQGKYVFATENSRTLSSVYKHYHCDIHAFVFLIMQENISSSNQITLRRLTSHLNLSIITPTLALDSFKETLDQLSSVPKINPL